MLLCCFLFQPTAAGADETLPRFKKLQLTNRYYSDGIDAEEDCRPIQLERGKRYAIKIEYWDRYGDAKMRLLWSSPSMLKSIVDQQWLYSPLVKENDKKNE